MSRTAPSPKSRRSRPRLDETQAQIDEKQAELEGKQDVLSRRVSNGYKDGGTGVLTLLMAADSFDDLLSDGHYIEKVNDADKQVIGEIRDDPAPSSSSTSRRSNPKRPTSRRSRQQASSYSWCRPSRQRSSSSWTASRPT